MDIHACKHIVMTCPLRSLELTQHLGEGDKIALQYIFAFCAVWGIGGNLEAGCWDKWDQHVRKLFDGTANFPGGSGTVFDYNLDPGK